MSLLRMVLSQTVPPIDILKASMMYYYYDRNLFVFLGKTGGLENILPVIRLR